MKPNSVSGFQPKNLPPRTKINETLSKILKAADSSSYSKISNANKLTTKERQIYKTKSTSIPSKPTRPSFIQKPSKNPRNTSIKTSYSPPNSTVQTNSRIQTEPPAIMTANKNYLNTLIQQRIPSVSDGKPEPAYLIDAIRTNMERIKGKSLSSENPIPFLARNQNNSGHRRYKTLLNMSNDSSINLSNLTSNAIQVSKESANFQEKKSISKETSANFSVEGLLRDFLQSNVKQKNLSVLKYLESFFELLDFLQRNDAVYGLIKEIVQLPFIRIGEQFESIKTLYREKILRVEFLMKEREKTDLVIRQLCKENKNIKLKLSQYEATLEKMKREKGSSFQKEKGSRSNKNIVPGNENRAPNFNDNLNDNRIGLQDRNLNLPRGVKKEFDEELKQKLRLNLDVVKRTIIQEEMNAEMGKIEKITNINNSIIDFHDEFMSKFEEFSISWKNKAIEENKFHY